MINRDAELIATLRKPVWWQALGGGEDDFWKYSYAPQAAANRIEELIQGNELIELEERQRVIDFLKAQALYFEQQLKETPQRFDGLRTEYATHRKSCLASAKAIEIGEHLK